MEQMSSFFVDKPWLLVIVRALIIILVTITIAKFIRVILNRGSKSLYKRFVYNIVTALIYIAGLVLVVSQIPQLGKVTQTILAGSGIAALAISLSAQESLNNIVSGAFIAIFKPFEVGNRVTLVNSKITGTIEDITLRHTVIKTFINSRVVIPNSVMNKEIIENSSLFDNRASSFVDISVAYESDIDKAIKIMADIIGNHPFYLDIRTDEEKETQPKVKVYTRDIIDNAVSLRANMWTNSVGENFEACSDARLQIKKEFDSAGIEIAYKKLFVINEY